MKIDDIKRERERGKIARDGMISWWSLFKKCCTNTHKPIWNAVCNPFYFHNVRRPRHHTWCDYKRHSVNYITRLLSQSIQIHKSQSTSTDIPYSNIVFLIKSNNNSVTVLLGSNFPTLSLEGASGLIQLHFIGNPRGRRSYINWKK